MPDITMCTGGSCPYKEKCYRYRARPNEHRQSYFVSPPVTSGWGPPHNTFSYCEHYIFVDDDIVFGLEPIPKSEPAPKPESKPRGGFKYL